MQRWEYAVADFTKLEKAVPQLDKLGADGWEAVGLVATWGRGMALCPSRSAAEAPTSRACAIGHPSRAARFARPLVRMSRGDGVHEGLRGAPDPAYRGRPASALRRT